MRRDLELMCTLIRRGPDTSVWCELDGGWVGTLLEGPGSLGVGRYTVVLISLSNTSWSSMNRLSLLLLACDSLTLCILGKRFSVSASDSLTLCVLDKRFPVFCFERVSFNWVGFLLLKVGSTQSMSDPLQLLFCLVLLFGGGWGISSTSQWSTTRPTAVLVSSSLSPSDGRRAGLWLVLLASLEEPNAGSGKLLMTVNGLKGDVSSSSLL